MWCCLNYSTFTFVWEGSPRQLTHFEKEPIFFYLSNEGISIIENAAACGLPVPEKLREILAQLRDKGGKSGKGGGSE
jgi:hypothetical protein